MKVYSVQTVEMLFLVFLQVESCRESPIYRIVQESTKEMAFALLGRRHVVEKGAQAAFRKPLNGKGPQPRSCFRRPVFSVGGKVGCMLSSTTKGPGLCIDRFNPT